MEITLIYRGHGFEASKFVDMPALPHQGMDIGIVLDDGAGQPGTEWFPVHKVEYHIGLARFRVKLATPLKYGRYKSTSTPTIGLKDFSSNDWRIRTAPEIEPFE